MGLYRKILEQHKFSSAGLKEVTSKVAALIQKIEASLGRQGIKAEVMLGGSAAKGTLIKGDFDCDIFVRFDKKYLSDNLSDLLEPVLGDVAPFARVHGSRDYFQIMSDGISYEIIPVLNVRSIREAKNVTDMSPLHVAWIRKRIDKSPGMADEILLAKLFCKSAGVYGAESHISGFSGHVLDILIAYYGTFGNLLKNAAGWKKFHVIDIEKHNTKDALNESKISPLIVIDPVQGNRNAVAALSMEKFELFRRKAKEFLGKPSEQFFERKNLSVAQISSQISKDWPGKAKLLIASEPLSGKVDVVGTKLLKAFEHIKTQLGLHDFAVLASGWSWGIGFRGKTGSSGCTSEEPRGKSKAKSKLKSKTKSQNQISPAYFWFVLDKSTLPEEKEHVGPPVFAKAGVEAFKEKHAKTFESGGRLYAVVTRKFTDAERFVGWLVKQEYMMERVKSIEVKKLEEKKQIRK
jgi:tRNA CCA-adding enzyme